MPEEKTKIVPGAADGRSGAVITFQCSNGHRINVPAKLAGKRGTCSKCGVQVVIPLGPASASPVAAAAPTVDDAALPELTAPEPVAPAPAPAEQAPAPDTFANLFVGETPAEPAVVDEIAIDVTGGVTEAASGVGSTVGDVVAGHAPENFQPPDDGGALENPTAQLVARLWLERAHEGVVEIHLAGAASPILPEFYEPRWSRGTHGLFASEAVDGTVTLTAVAWDSVQKIIVRGVKGLPDGMFE